MWYCFRGIWIGLLILMDYGDGTILIKTHEFWFVSFHVTFQKAVRCFLQLHSCNFFCNTNARPNHVKPCPYVDNNCAVNRLVGWNCRIRQLHLYRGVRPPTNKCPGYNTKRHLIVSFQSWSFGECGVPLNCYYFQFHSDPELGCYLFIK